MKGILLAGGSGSRLYPLTKIISKQLLPVYDKPAIYYPLSTLMLAGIREVLIISTPRDLPFIRSLLGNGSQLGMQLFYEQQAKPEGIAQAFIIGAEFIGSHSVSLILGDNIFYGNDLIPVMQRAMQIESGASIFPYHVHDPERYGVVEFDRYGKALHLEEKPKHPKSSWAVTGLYYYGNDVIAKAKQLKPSARGELEITDLNRMYLNEERLHVFPLGRGVAWLDSGTYESLLSASQFVQTLEQRQGLKVACIEEIAFVKKYIDIGKYKQLVEDYGKSQYGEYLRQVLRENPGPFG